MNKENLNPLLQAHGILKRRVSSQAGLQFATRYQQELLIDVIPNKTTVTMRQTRRQTLIPQHVNSRRSSAPIRNDCITQRKVSAECYKMTSNCGSRKVLADLPVNSIKPSTSSVNYDNFNKYSVSKIPTITTNATSTLDSGAQRNLNLEYRNPRYLKPRLVAPRRSCNEAGTVAGKKNNTAGKYNYLSCGNDDGTSDYDFNDYYEDDVFIDGQDISHTIMKIQGMRIDFHIQDYLEDIMNYLFENDSKFIVPTSMVIKKSLCKESRAKIINWMLELQVYFNISSETYLKAVRVFDCILFNTTVATNMYCLVAITCLWVISKYDETNELSKKEILSMARGKYTEQDLYAMERKVFKFINYNCSIPEPISFVEYFLQRIRITNKCVLVGTYYILESFVLSTYCSTFSSSKLATSAVYIAMKYLREDTTRWKQVCYRGDDRTIKYMQQALSNILEEKFPYKNCYKKYIKKEKLSIARIFKF